MPRLSVVVVAHDMGRELPRTIRSLSPGYQRGMSLDDYELIVVDNGSPQPVDFDELAARSPNLSGIRIDPAPPSPARAANAGLAAARGELVGLIVDGARLASPGLLASAVLAGRLGPRVVVASLGWHLGPARHMDAGDQGYDQVAEDALLESIGWPGDGDRLFEIATLGGSSAWGWFSPLAESSALFMPRPLWDELGGLDEAFALPGGGMVNHDLYARACALSGVQLVTLLGDGTFHQIHGGSATSGRFRFEDLQADYVRLRGAPYLAPTNVPIFVGRVPEAVEPLLAEATELASRYRERQRTRLR
jgi:glycosyltransferase involved in cell wall biosynthesis